ncbi:MAG: hypothetical protein K0R21_1050 [Anaerocolumna sp.]|jgi:hypothetical protein|nr:hypothetical protein [Anaerocolumna sp.]
MSKLRSPDIYDANELLGYLIISASEIRVGMHIKISIYILTGNLSLFIEMSMIL